MSYQPEPEPESESEASYIPWNQKIGTKLFWRGPTTGAQWTEETPWRQGHRQRLVGMMDDQGIDRDGASGGGGGFFDFGFTGKPTRESLSSRGPGGGGKGRGRKGG